MWLSWRRGKISCYFPRLKQMQHATCNATFRFLLKTLLYGITWSASNKRCQLFCHLFAFNTGDNRLDWSIGLRVMKRPWEIMAGLNWLRKSISFGARPPTTRDCDVFIYPCNKFVVILLSVGHGISYVITRHRSSTFASLYLSLFVR